jgi:hypothetical protein
MSLIAEVSPELVKDAGKVAAFSELLKILLIDGRATLDPKYVARGRQLLPGTLKAEIQQDCRVSKHEDIISTIIRFQFFARQTKSSRTPFVSISATFLGEYRTAKGFRPTTKELDAFLKANATFNCWPYWREYVQSSVARMDLPPTTLPFFRIKSISKDSRPKHLPEKKQTNH